MLHEYGQPLHAFDLDIIKGDGIIVDMLPKDTVFLSLDEVARKLDAEDLMICDAELNPMCIGGVFGGLHSGVKNETTRIFLESAHFDPETIRRTSMRHNLRTDAAKVFEKGSDPNITDEALWRAANLMKELCGATIAEPVFDRYPSPILKKSIHVRRQKVSELIGVEFSHDKLVEVFDHLNFIIEKEDDNAFDVLIPTDKADVLREVDVIEEILRIYGYDHVPVSAKLKTSIVHDDGNALHTLRNKLIDRFTSKGYHQMMNLSLSRSAYYDENRTDLVGVLNTSNSHLDIMRPDMLLSALETASHNIKHQNRNIRMFEFGKTYSKSKEEKYIETEKLAFIVSGEQHPEHWQAKSLPADFYDIKSMIELAFPDRISSQLSYLLFDEADALFGKRVTIREKEVGLICRIHPDLAKKFDIDQAIYFGELDFEACHQAWSSHQVTFQSISKFPGVQRDMALIVNVNVSYEQIDAVIKAAKQKKLAHHNLFDIYTNEEHVGKNKKSMGVRLDFIDENKTLQDKEVDKMVKKVMAALERELGAVLR